MRVRLRQHLERHGQEAVASQYGRRVIELFVAGISE
jgi:hypothetical protein